jgi:hypothetical protein
VGKQLIVSEVPEAGGIISHGVRGTGNVVITKAVTMMALVEAGKAKKVGSRIAGSDGAFGGAADGG